MTMKTLTSICFLALFSLTMSCGNAIESTETDPQFAKICYVPIDASTYAPMTIVNFSNHCADVGKINIRDRRYKQILSRVSSAKAGRFTDGDVRVRLALPDLTVIYIDANGGVKQAAVERKLNDDDLLAVKRILEILAKERGVPGLE